MVYYDKYLKYKNKYLALKQQLGGEKNNQSNPNFYLVYDIITKFICEIILRQLDIMHFMLDTLINKKLCNIINDNKKLCNIINDNKIYDLEKLSIDNKIYDLPNLNSQNLHELIITKILPDDDIKKYIINNIFYNKIKNYINNINDRVERQTGNLTDLIYNDLLNNDNLKDPIEIKNLNRNICLYINNEYIKQNLTNELLQQLHNESTVNYNEFLKEQKTKNTKKNILNYYIETYTSHKIKKSILSNIFSSQKTPSNKPTLINKYDINKTLIYVVNDFYHNNFTKKKIITEINKLKKILIKKINDEFTIFTNTNIMTIPNLTKIQNTLMENITKIQNTLMKTITGDKFIIYDAFKKKEILNNLLNMFDKNNNLIKNTELKNTELINAFKTFTQKIENEFTNYINLESEIKRFEGSVCNKTTEKLIEFDKNNNLITYLITYLFKLDVVNIYKTITPYFIELNKFVIDQITEKETQRNKQLEEENVRATEMKQNFQHVIDEIKTNNTTHDKFGIS